jgi:lipopolysaccharide biosynthesis regulator YciM
MPADTSVASARGVLGAVAHAGSRGSGEYRCCDCGYGIVTLGIVPLCPMCNGAWWEPTPRRDGGAPPAVTVTRAPGVARRTA